MKYSRILAEFYGNVWAIREETLLAMSDLLRTQSAGVKWSVEEIQTRIAVANQKTGFQGHDDGEFRFLAIDSLDLAAQGEIQARSRSKSDSGRGSVAVIPMMGTISNRISMMAEVSGGGGVSIQQLTANFRQALSDPNCKAIVFDVDSPGGSIEGVMELASEIYNARAQKPITAVFNSMGCSAAYWLGSAASDVVCTPSGQCGSIGVFMMSQDVSEALKAEGVAVTLIKAGKYKAEGHPSQPLSEEARSFLQSQVDSVYSTFVKDVGKNRGASQAAVREGFGQGRSLFATDAVKAGLADRVATLDEVLGKYGVKSGAAASPMAAQHVTVGALNAKTKPEDSPDDNDDPADDNDQVCEGQCSACQNCSGMEAKAVKAEGMVCQCNCTSCQACTCAQAEQAMAAIAQRRRRLQLL